MNKTIEKAKEYFYNIDFLRVIFIFFIVNLHLFAKSNLGAYKQLYGDIFTATRTGYLTFDYFFIIAGFFLLYAFKDMPVVDFVKKKICKFWPLMLFIFIITLALSFCNLIKFNWCSNLMSLFFLESVGLTMQKSNIGITWFISALMFASVFYYYIYKYFKKENCDLTTCLLTLFAYVAIIHGVKDSFAADRMSTIGLFFNLGLLRAIAGMGLGIIIYNIYEHFKDQIYVQTAKQFLLTSFVELSLLWFVIYETGFHKLAFKNKFILIFAFAALLLMFALKRGFVSRFFNRKCFANISKYVLAIYLTHPIILLLYKKFVYVPAPGILREFPILFVMVMYVSIFVFAVLAHHFVEKPGAKKMQRFLFNKVIKTTSGEQERA